MILYSSNHKKYSNGDKCYWWFKGDNYFTEEELSWTINMVCRLSKKIVNIILEFKELNNSFIFHEILFASLCEKYNLLKYKISVEKKYIKVKETKQFKKIDIKKKIKTIKNKNIKIYHPLKEWYLHV